MRKFGYTVVRGLFIVVCLIGAWFGARHFIERVPEGYKSLATGLAIVGSAALLFSEVMLERTIKFEYEHHRGSWLDDDCPRVSFWRPDDHRASYSAGKNVRWKLLFSTPRWAGGESSCAIWLRGYRIGWLVSTCCFLTFLVLTSL